jgi:hypothetical protein
MRGLFSLAGGLSILIWDGLQTALSPDGQQTLDGAMDAGLSFMPLVRAGVTPHAG